MFAELYILTIVLTIGSHYFLHYCCYKSIPIQEIQDKTCSICLDELSQVRFVCKTHCNHYFCSNCLQDWLLVKRVCPMCNSNL
jgi:hypothetical protein